MSFRFPPPAAGRIARWLVSVPAALLLVSSPVHGHPRSCKPQVPVSVQLRVLDPSPDGQIRFETVVQASRPVDDLAMTTRLSDGVRWAGGRRELAGKLAAGARTALPMAVNLPRRGHAEVYVQVSFTTAGGSHMTRGAYLSFDDGGPTQPPRGRESSWDGNPVLEFPAAGVSR
jgi:hypothetical protein